MYCGAYWSADEGADADTHDATHHTTTHHHTIANYHPSSFTTYCITHTTAQHDTYATPDTGACGLCGCVVWMRCELHEAVQDQCGTARRWW